MAGVARIIQCFRQPHLLGGSQHPIGFSDKTNAQRQAGDGLEASLQNRARRVVATHAVDGHPKAFRVIDGGVAIAMATLQPSKRVEDQGLQHGAGHVARARHHRAGDRASGAC